MCAFVVKKRDMYSWGACQVG